MYGGARRTQLKVIVESCAALRSVDSSLFSSNKSDPYVKCFVQDRPYINFQTPAQKRTLDPVFGYTEDIEVRPGDNLEFCVYSQVPAADDKATARAVNDSGEFLGRIVVPYSHYFPSGMDDTMFLEDVGEKHKGKSSIKITILATAYPEPDRSKMTRAFIRLVRGVELIGARRPYAICEIEGKPNSQVITRVKAGEGPVWDEEDELVDFVEGDDIKIRIYDFGDNGDEIPFGSAILPSFEFYPDGYEGELELRGTPSGEVSHVEVSVDVVIPVQPKKVREDPGKHVLPGEHWPVPFALRSLESGRVHQLVAYTRVGRSRTKLEPARDLIIDSPASLDVSRFHAYIKVWQVADSNQWKVRVYKVASATKGGSGAGLGPGGGHDGGGTSVHHVQVSRDMEERLHEGKISRGDWFKGHRVDEEIGTGIETGTIIRFGLHEFWVLEKSTLFQRSQLAAKAMKQTRTLNLEDPSEVRHLVVPSIAALHALQGCHKWFDFITVVLEWLGEPDEPPCVEHIEIQDELRQPISRHHSTTLEEQQEYDMKLVLHDVQIGHAIRIKLCSDPRLLGPVLNYLDEKKRATDKMLQKRDKIPD
eukprot:TRINITY_DN26010_c0_g1_i1.p1 TRINITY_DN26010_c0_g1~~TRINITY_DN26010_c0_g1_i1.p1  ORF type:complete len:590 (+),score=97.80 TRINITY_DN26010_c0_g1_i1:111-1880(+)